jgi:hypothetical protein
MLALYTLPCHSVEAGMAAGMVPGSEWCGMGWYTVGWYVVRMSGKLPMVVAVSVVLGMTSLKTSTSREA